MNAGNCSLAPLEEMPVFRRVEEHAVKIEALRGRQALVEFATVAPMPLGAEHPVVFVGVVEHHALVLRAMEPRGGVPEGVVE